MTQETEKFQEVGEQAGASQVFVMIYGTSCLFVMGHTDYNYPLSQVWSEAPQNFVSVSPEAH